MLRAVRCAGLKLDDVRNEWHPDVQTALSRLSPEELSNRNKRLKRAMDLSLKHSELNKEAQAAVEPLVGYLPLERAREELSLPAKPRLPRLGLAAKHEG